MPNERLIKMDERDHEPLKEGEHVCDMCAFGEDEVRAREAQMMKDVGWYAHYVHDEPSSPFNINYHTHGLDVTFKHKDLQACLPAQPQMLHEIIFNIIRRIKSGEQFNVGDRVSNIIGGSYQITFIAARECGRDVLRVIFPDKAGILEKELMDSSLSPQYEGLDND